MANTVSQNWVNHGSIHGLSQNWGYINTPQFVYLCLSYTMRWNGNWNFKQRPQGTKLLDSGLVAWIVFPCISSRWFSPKFPGHIKIPQVKPHFSHPNWRQNCGFFSHSGPLPHLAVLLILPNCSGRPGTSALPCQISSLGHPTGPWWIVWVGNLPNSWIMLDPRQDSEENWLTGDSEKRRANHGLRGSTPDESTRVISGGYLQKDPKSIQKCSKWN